MEVAAAASACFIIVLFTFKREAHLNRTMYFHGKKLITSMAKHRNILKMSLLFKANGKTSEVNQAVSKD